MIGMVLLRAHLSLQRCPIRQPAKQLVIIALQPAIKRSKPSPFERKQNPDRHHFTRMQPCLWDFFHSRQLVIDSTKNVNDNLFRWLVETKRILHDNEAGMML